MAAKGYTDYEPVDGAYPGVSGDFVNQQQQRLGWGITNVNAAFDSKKTKPKPSMVEKKLSRVGERLETAGNKLQYAPGTPGKVGKVAKYAGRYIKKNGLGPAKNPNASKTEKIIGQTLAKTQVSFAMGWTGFLNILSLPIGILALGAFGGTAIVGNTTGGETIAQIAAWMVGFEYFNIWVLAIGLYVLHAFIIITMFAGSYVQLKLGGLEPLGGRASALKNLVFIGAFVISAIPGTTFVPWIFGWLFIVILYPN